MFPLVLESLQSPAVETGQSTCFGNSASVAGCNPIFTPCGGFRNITRDFPSVLWSGLHPRSRKQTQSELEDLSRNVALAFLQEMNSDIIGFEQSVKTVLETGQTPLRTFHTHQRMVLRFDRNMQMNAPFVEHNETKGADVLFHPAYQVGRTIVETDDRTRDNIQYQIVKNLQSTGRRAEAKYVVAVLVKFAISSRFWSQVETFGAH